jgi:predicted phage terminase large subunit-like protein
MSHSWILRFLERVSCGGQDLHQQIVRKKGDRRHQLIDLLHLEDRRSGHRSLCTGRRSRWRRRWRLRCMHDRLTRANRSAHRRRRIARIEGIVDSARARRRRHRSEGPVGTQVEHVVDQAPADLDIVRYWDLAATEKTELNDPDWTVGIKLGRDRNRGYWLLDVVRARANPGDVERLLLNTATQDGKQVVIGFGQDPGQAGKSQAQHLVRALSAFTARAAAESGDKLTRFGPFSSQCRAGNVKILRGLWNEDLFRVLEGFPDLAHDDEVDACSGALEMLNPQMDSWGAFEFARQRYEQRQAER